MPIDLVACYDAWYNDPSAFAEDVWGSQLWSGQAEIMRAVARSDRVTVRSGHKTGKSRSCAILAIWWALTRLMGRVVMTSASGRQVSEILWPEVVRLRTDAKIPLGGDIAKNPDGGWRFDSGAEIVGFSTDKPERVAGFSGADLFFIADEASGIPDRIYKAINGNLAGGGKILALSNPTRLSGWHYDTQHEARNRWDKIVLSSFECAKRWPNEAPKARGLATIGWCQEEIDRLGERDPDVLVRVFGEYPDNEVGSFIGRDIVGPAIVRGDGDVHEDGVLQIGIDLSGEGKDKTVFCDRRGQRLFAPKVLFRPSTNEIVKGLIAHIRRVRRGIENVRAVFDASGLGVHAVGFFETEIQRPEYGGEFENVEVVRVVASESATEPKFVRMRDQLWGGLKRFLENGGALPDDDATRDEDEISLSADICAPKFELTENSQIKIESKKELRKRLGRSTDLADAACLATFEDNRDQTFSAFTRSNRGRRR